MYFAPPPPPPRRKMHRRSASNNAYVLGFGRFGSASCFPDGGGADLLDR